MPSALEIYYRNKTEKGKTPEAVKQLAAKEVLGEAPKKSIGAFHRLLDILDRPGNATRALLIGKLGGLKGLIPFAQSIENLTGLNIALDPDEKIRGEEVITTWFGKQRQRKGKIDPVDLLGFMVEVVADPLWLTSIGGFTKLGKAAKLSQSALKAANAAGDVTEVAKLIKLAKSGKSVQDAGKLAKAFKKVYDAGQAPRLAKTWAQQAAKGQRALLSFAGKPVIKGEKFFKQASKTATTLKTGGAGKLFLAATRRVPEQYKELHDIYVHFGRDLPAVQRAGYMKKLQQLYDEGAKAGLSAEQMDKTVRRYVQRAYAKEGSERFIAQTIGKRRKVAAKKIKVLKGQQKVASVENLPKITKRIEYQRKYFAKGLRKTKEGAVPVESIAKTQRAITQRTGEAEDILKGLTPEQAAKVKEIGGEYETIHKGLIGKELAAGAPAKQITYPLGYARRELTNSFKEWVEANKHRPVVGGFARDMSTRNAAQRMRNKIIGGMTDEEALARFRSLGYEGDSVFKTGMAEPTARRIAMSTRTVGSGRTIQESIKKFGRPDKPFWRGKGYVPASEVAEAAGMRPEVIQSFGGKVIPKEVATALMGMHELATSEESLKGFWNGWANIQRYMKGAFTMPWPAYHSRNMFSNFVLNWLGGVKSPQAYLDALLLQTGRGKPIKLATGQVLSPDDLLKVADDWGILGRSVGMFEPEEVVAGGVRKAQTVLGRHVRGRGAIRQTGQKVGVAIEDNARLAHFIDRIGQGYSFQDAAASAKNVLFDYGDLSNFEKRYLRDRGIFFYTFARKNIVLQGRKLFEEPGKQALWSHIAGGTPEITKEEPMPDWWREQLVSRPLVWPFTGTKEGEETRIAGMGMPIEEAFGSFAGPGRGPWARLQRIASRQAARLSPLVKTPLEFVSEKNLFYNTPIGEQGYAPYFVEKLPKIGQKMLGVQKVEGKERPYYTMNPHTSWLLQQTPAARLWSSAATISKQGQPPGIAASHFLLGQKPRIYNPQIQQEKEARAAREDMLKYYYRTGKVRKFSRFYVPKTQEVDPDLKLLLQTQ